MITKLIEYQSVDSELRAIEQELIASEDRKKGIAARKFLDTVSETLAELDEKAAAFDTAYTKYSDVYSRLSETQKEFGDLDEYNEEEELSFMMKKAQELMDELKSLEKQIAHLQEEIAALCDRYTALKKKTAAAQKQFRECGQKYTALKESKAGAQKEIQQRLAVLEKEVEPALMEQYKRKRADKIFPILYEYNGNGFCPQCRTELSGLAKSTLARNGFTECDNCGRLLYGAAK